MIGNRTTSVVDLLCECAADDHGMARLRDALGVGLCPGWQQRCLGKVADMVEAELADMERRNAELEEKVGRMAETDARWEAMRRDLENAIAERDACYMRLPVDADGVPIRVGDVLDPPKGSEEYGRLMVAELTYDGEDWYFKGEIPASFTGQAGYFNVLGFTHVKPDTVESLLQRLADEVWEASTTCQTTWSDSGLDGIAERYAERIREAVEHG